MSLTELTRAEMQELRDLGWSIRRRRARRPSPPSCQVVLEVGQDVFVDEGGEGPPLVVLESER